MSRNTLTGPPSTAESAPHFRPNGNSDIWKRIRDFAHRGARLRRHRIGEKHIRSTAAANEQEFSVVAHLKLRMPPFMSMLSV